MLEYLCNKCKIKIWWTLNNVLRSEVSFAIQFLCMRKNHVCSFCWIFCIQSSGAWVFRCKSIEKASICLSILQMHRVKTTSETLYMPQFINMFQHYYFLVSPSMRPILAMWCLKYDAWLQTKSFSLELISYYFLEIWQDNRNAMINHFFPLLWVSMIKSCFSVLETLW